MTKFTEFLILDTIKKHSSIMPLFSAGYSYGKVVEWVFQLEKNGLIEYDEMEQRHLTASGLEKWKSLKSNKKAFTIMPLTRYKVKQKDIDDIYLP